MNKTKDSKKRRAMEILRLYSVSNLPDILEKKVKGWIANGASSEKENALKEIWDHPVYVVSNRERKVAWKKIEQKIGFSPAPRFRPERNRWIWIPAVIIPVFILITVLYFTGNIKKEEVPVVYSGLTKEITEDEVRHLVLTDGTEVWLNKRSEFIYGNDRRTWLEGEALFKVSGSEAGQFIVVTEYGEVRVVGTRFNLNAYPAEVEMKVTLYEGKLELGVLDTVMHMGAGEEWVINRETNSLEKGTTEKEVPNWSREFVLYDNWQLKDIFRDLEKRYFVKFKGGTEEILNDSMTVKFDVTNDSIDDVMILISTINGKFSYRIENGTVHID